MFDHHYSADIPPSSFVMHAHHSMHVTPQQAFEQSTKGFAVDASCISSLTDVTM